MQLRDYQRKAIDGVFTYWLEYPGKNPVLVLPTSAGKTFILANLLMEFFRVCPHARVLILAHRSELIDQAEAEIIGVWPDAPIGVYSAALDRREDTPILVASRDSIRGKLDQFQPFDLVVIDEAHNVSQDEETGYRKIIARVQERRVGANALGLTATPFRASGYIYGEDGETLFDGVAYSVPLKLLLDRGYLAPVVSKAVDPEALPDLQGVRSQAGDFAPAELNRRVSQSELVRAAVREWYETAIQKQRRKLTVFFCVSIAHAELVRDELLDLGFRCPIISGKTPKAERALFIQAARELKIPGLINVGTLTEGTNIKPIDCLAVMRPTKSLALWIQVVGRGMRLSPETGKRDCLLLDFGGCLDRFGPIDQAAPADKRKGPARVKECEECQEIVSVYARRCSGCGFQFMPEPVKVCPECRTENSPSAASCSACETVFVTHGGGASNAAVFSDQAGPVYFEVDRITAHKVEKGGAAPYLVISFQDASGLHVARKSLYIGYHGLAGEIAAIEWTQLTRGETPVPASVDGAVFVARQDQPFRVHGIEYLPRNPSQAIRKVYYQ